MDYDYSRVSEVVPEVIIKEHPVGEGPVSYMAFTNLKNARHEIDEICAMLNHCDDLPQWVDQMITEATDRLTTAKSYILSIKDV